VKTEIEPGSKASPSKWISVNTNSRVVSFLEFLGSSPAKTCYALTFIESSKAMPVILKCGSDDGIKIILNGKLIHNNNVWRGVVPDDDIVRCEFKKGINSVLVKINNGSGDFGFCMKTLSSDGLPADNIKVMLPNSFSNDEIFKSIFSSFNIYTTYDKTDGSAKFLTLIASESCFPLNSKDKFHLKLALIDRKGNEIDTFYKELLSGIGNFKSKEIIHKPKSLSPGRYVIRLSVLDEKEKLLSEKENVVFWN